MTFLYVVLMLIAALNVVDAAARSSFTLWAFNVFAMAWFTLVYLTRRHPDRK